MTDLTPETVSSRAARAVFRLRAAMRSAEARAVLATDNRESTVALLAAANCSVLMDMCCLRKKVIDVFGTKYSALSTKIVHCSNFVLWLLRHALAGLFAFSCGALPVLELRFVHLDVQLHDPGLQARLHIGHSLVVDDGRDLLEEETE